MKIIWWGLFNTVVLNNDWIIEKYPTTIGRRISPIHQESLHKALDAHQKYGLIIPSTEVVYFDDLKIRWFRQEFIQGETLKLWDLQWALLRNMKQQLTNWFKMQNEVWICMDVLWLPTRKRHGHDIARALLSWGNRNPKLSLSNRIIKWDIPYYVDITTHWVGTIFSPKASPIWYIVDQAHQSVAKYIHALKH